MVDYKKKYGSFGATNFGGSVYYSHCLYCYFFAFINGLGALLALKLLRIV